MCLIVEAFVGSLGCDPRSLQVLEVVQMIRLYSKTNCSMQQMFDRNSSLNYHWANYCSYNG